MTLGVRLLSIKIYLSYFKQLIISSVAFEVLETLDGNSCISSDKMKDILELILSQSIDVLPEPLDQLIAGCTVGVLYILF